MDVVEVLLLEGALCRFQTLLGGRDVDVRLSQVHDELLDRDEFRRGAPRLLQAAPLCLLMSGLPSLREKPIDLARRLNDLGRLTGLNRGFCSLQEGRRLPRPDALPGGPI